MVGKEFAAALMVALTILGAAGRACEISGDDFSALFDFHSTMSKGIPRAIPGYNEILKRAPASLEGLSVECLAVGPLRFIHPRESRSVFVLDNKRAFDRWEAVDTGKAPWQVAVRRFIRNYLPVHRSTLAQVYGRPEFSDEERALLERAKNEALPPAVQIRIPQKTELSPSRSAEVNAATRGLISRLILQAVVAHMAQQRPGGWVERLEVGPLGASDSFVSIGAVIAMGKGKSESVTLKIAVNPKVAPYVGAVYPTSP